MQEIVVGCGWLYKFADHFFFAMRLISRWKIFTNQDETALLKIIQLFIFHVKKDSTDKKSWIEKVNKIISR